MIAPREKVQINTLGQVDLADAEKLWVPVSKTNPLFDAFIAPDLFIQVTSAARHAANGDGLVRACKVPIFSPEACEIVEGSSKLGSS